MTVRSGPLTNRWRPRVAVGVLTCAAVIGAASCGREQPEPPARTLRLGWNEPVGTLEPPNARGLADQNFLRLLYEGLTRSSSTGSLEPALASSWETTDNRVWRFHLAPGRTFHDGTPVRASHVVASWTDLARIAAARPGVFALIPVSGFRDVTAGHADTVRGLAVLDSLTLQITLDEPLAMLPLVLSRSEYQVKAPTSRPDRPVGSGAWRLLRGKPGDSTLVLVRSGTPVLVDADTLVLRVTPTTEVVAAFRDRRIDCVDQVVPAVRTELALRSDITLDVTPNAGLARLALRGAHPALRDLRVRQALAYALDREGIARKVAESNVLVTASRVPRLLSAATDEPTALRYDPRLARTLLHEAGADSLRLRLARWPYWLAGDSTRDVLTSVRDYWRAVGLRVELVTPPDFWRALIDSTADVQPQYVYPSFPEAIAFMSNLYAPAGPRADLVLPEDGTAEHYRAILDSGRRSPTERTRRLHDADSLLAQVSPDVMLWQVPLVAARHRDIRSCQLGLFTDRAPAHAAATAR